MLVFISAHYVYKLIETLLPKAHAKMLEPGKHSLAKIEDEKRLKMVELWAPDDTPRLSWLKVCSLR